MAASNADHGYSATFGIDDGAGGYTEVAEVFSITPPGRSREPIDVSHLNSDNGYREFIPAGLIDGGEVGIELNYVPSASDAVISALEDTGTQSFQITHSNGTTLTFTGFCTSHEPGPLTPDEKMTVSATFKITGQPTLA